MVIPRNEFRHIEKKPWKTYINPLITSLYIKYRIKAHYGLWIVHDWARYCSSAPAKRVWSHQLPLSSITTCSSSDQTKFYLRRLLSLSLSQPITLIWYLKFIHIHRFIFVPIDSGNVYLRFLFRPNFFLRRVVSGVVMMIRQEIGLLKFPYLIFLRFKGLYICRLVRASWKLWILDRFRVFCDVASKLIDA